MFNFLKKQPKAVIQISRLTATEENVVITVNATELTKESIYASISAAGEALRQRLIDNNMIALQSAGKELDADKVQDIVSKSTGFKRVK